ncbi:hypothetical protein VCHA53O466_320038 [Vibrio chagasii]|nr:hypothetical protein VCHA53O466_320038 [Vibrio chagasii]
MPKQNKPDITYTFYLANGETVTKTAPYEACIDDLCDEVGNETGWYVENVEH